jgi:D-galactarolactone isomerase
VYDARFPVAPTAVLRPADASVADYRRFQSALGLDRVVVVQPTTYGLDNRCQLEAVAEFGDSARAVVVVDARTPPDELARLDAVGARGARFHMLPGGSVGWDDLPVVAARIADLGWHVQMQLDGRELPQHLAALLALPTPLVVDHVGRFMPPVTTDHPAFVALRTLLDTGRTWVKLSAPYESAPASSTPDTTTPDVAAPDPTAPDTATPDGRRTFPAVTALATALVASHPERMLWASNWPHPGQAEPLTSDELRALMLDWLPDPGVRHRVLVANPTELYRFPPLADHRSRP